MSLHCPLYHLRCYVVYMPASVASVSFSFAPCVSLCGLLSPSPAGGVDEEVGRFVHHIQEVNQFKKVAMTECRNLSASLIATICVGLCSSSSMEELVVTSEVSLLSVCLTTPYELFRSLNCCSESPTHVPSMHLTGEAPSSHWGEPP